MLALALVYCRVRDSALEAVTGGWEVTITSFIFIFIFIDRKKQIYVFILLPTVPHHHCQKQFLRSSHHIGKSCFILMAFLPFSCTQFLYVYRCRGPNSMLLACRCCGCVFFISPPLYLLGVLSNLSSNV